MKAQLALIVGAANWLDARRMRRWTSVCLIVQLLCGAFVFAGTHGWVVKLPQAATTDFVSFYAAGKLAATADPALVYDRAAHHAAEQAATAPGIGYVYFFYPPVYLLYCRMLALLPYLPAFFSFELLGVGLCALVLRRILGRMPAGWWLPLASFSPALWNFGFGQNAFMTAFCLGAGSLLLQRGRDLAGGLILGLLFYKPHTGLLLPFALLAAGNWRAIAGAAISVTGSILASIALFGWQVWRKFLLVSLHSPAEFASGAITPLANTISVLGAARDHGVPASLAWGLQAATQLVVIGAILWCWRTRTKDAGGARHAALISGALLMMPIALFYDLTALVMAGAWILHDARRGGFLPGEKCTLAAIWLGGLLCYPVSRALHMPLGLLCVGAMFTLSLRRHLRAAYHPVNAFGFIVSPAASALRAHVAGQDDKMAAADHA